MLAILGLGCRQSPSPSLTIDAAVLGGDVRRIPDSARVVKAAIRRATQRSRGEPWPESHDTLRGAIGSEPPRLWVGQAICRQLARAISAARSAGRDVYLLWGSFHDAPAQIAGLAWLLSPACGLRIDAAAIEQFDAAWFDGRRMIEGDDALLADLAQPVRRRAALARLIARQKKKNYTGWKYDYLDQIAEVLAMAIASNVPLVGCDLPLKPQRRLAKLDPDAVDAMRELHCVGNLSRRAGRHGVFLMAWGESHLPPAGVSRFLPPTATVIALRTRGGRRLSRPEKPSVIQFAHVAVPTGPWPSAAKATELRATIFLRTAENAGERERTRDDRVDGGSSDKGLRVTVDMAAARFSLDGGSFVDTRLPIAASAGAHYFVLQALGHVAVGGFDLEVGESLQMHFSADLRQLQQTHLKR
ncbi:MAG: hypothetical protein H6707_11795 [Deltaproteobacteria bacterium]|nr:hypothetical protein [Deltaproteobacteria bacterium]